MDELWVRIGLVALMLVVAVSAAVWLRKGRLSSIRDVTSGELVPGVYFFSSEGCSTCAQARDELERALGHGSYTEVRWEEEAEWFRALDVDAVPAVLIVRVPGIGRLYPGQPGRALAEL